ncbi:MAG TPA: endonuclease/exonuclease/phosphatase family protein [Jiangellaceae bacterium]|nr:endonuclease/exonuclease/phosphatase family protein [Jiangellaceae bacterium]
MNRSRLTRWRVAAGAAATAVVVAGLGVAPGAATGAPAPVSAVTTDVGVYNVYLGANLRPLFGATSIPDLIQRAGTIYAEMERTDFPQRAQAIAELIAEERPDVLGLNEVALWETAPWTFIQTPDGPIPVVTGPYTTTFDFEQILLDALAAAGEPYTVVAKNRNFSSSAIPIAIPISPTQAGRFTDHDLILVRTESLKHMSVSNARSFNFSTESSFSVNLLGLDIVVQRGWSTVDITKRGRTFRFVNTHLEAFGNTPLQDEWRNLQAAELVADLEASPHPIVLVGDINARPTMCQDFRQPPQFGDQNVVAYGALEDAGLREVWPVVYPKDPCGPDGWTSGQDGSLLAPSELDHRIDVVFLSEEFSALQAETIGEELDDRTEPSGFWPSDHAGSVAKIRLDART